MTTLDPPLDAGPQSLPGRSGKLSDAALATLPAWLVSRAAVLGAREQDRGLEGGTAGGDGKKGTVPLFSVQPGEAGLVAGPDEQEDGPAVMTSVL